MMTPAEGRQVPWHGLGKRGVTVSEKALGGGAGVNDVLQKSRCFVKGVVVDMTFFVFRLLSPVKPYLKLVMDCF